MIQTLHDWGGRPLSRALLLSAALHVTLAMLVQPRFGGQERVVVLNARIAPPKPEAAPETPVEEAPAPGEAAQVPEAAAQPAPSPDRVERRTAEPAPFLPPPPTIPVTPSPAEPDAVPPGSALPVVQPAATGVQTAPALPQPAADLPSVPVMQDPHWYSARQVDRRPEPLQEISPEYPPQARRDNLQGSVVVQVHIDESGRVREVEIVEADPPGVFEASVLEAYGEARFTPALRDGRPVRYLGRYRVRFELE